MDWIATQVPDSPLFEVFDHSWFLIAERLKYLFGEQYADAWIHVLGIVLAAFFVYLRWISDKKNARDKERRDAWLADQRKLWSDLGECRYRLATESPGCIDGELIGVIPKLWYWPPAKAHHSTAESAPGFLDYVKLRSIDRGRASLDRFSYALEDFVLDAAGAYIWMWLHPGAYDSGDDWRKALQHQLKGVRAGIELFEQNVYLGWLEVGEGGRIARKSRKRLSTRRRILEKDIESAECVNPEWPPVKPPLLPLIVPNQYKRGIAKLPPKEFLTVMSCLRRLLEFPSHMLR